MFSGLAFLKNRFMHMQIDIRKIENKTASGYLYTGDRCVKIIMLEEDYRLLIHDGFFIRDGRSEDSAGVLNTTNVYEATEQTA